MDKIVSSVYFEGEVYVFTEHGKVYKMYKDHTGIVLFQIIATLGLS